MKAANQRQIVLLLVVAVIGLVHMRDSREHAAQNQQVMAEIKSLRQQRLHDDGIRSSTPVVKEVARWKRWKGLSDEKVVAEADHPTGQQHSTGEAGRKDAPPAGESTLTLEKSKNLPDLLPPNGAFDDTKLLQILESIPLTREGLVVGFDQLRSAVPPLAAGVGFKPDVPPMCTKVTQIGEIKTITTGKQKGGHYHDGGWYVCSELMPAQGCVSYLFGLGNDSFFDRKLASLGCEVHSFDPSPTGLQHAKDLMAAGQMPANMHFHDVGLAHFDGEVITHRPQAGNQYSQQPNSVRDGMETVSFSVQRLETIVASLGHDHIDMLKLDIEGGEFEVLVGLVRGPLIEKINSICLEMHDFSVYSQSGRCQVPPVSRGGIPPPDCPRDKVPKCAPLQCKLRDGSWNSPELKIAHTLLEARGFAIYTPSGLVHSRIYMQSTLTEACYGRRAAVDAARAAAAASRVMLEEPQPHWWRPPDSSTTIADHTILERWAKKQIEDPALASHGDGDGG